MRFLIIILAFISCNNKELATKNVQKDTLTQAIDEPVYDIPFKEKNRVIWQKPNMIIDQLGDLTDKTIADIGAGPYGYFSLRLAYKAKKVLAIDIDPAALQFMDSLAKKVLPEELLGRFETRLVDPDNPRLKQEEADIALIVNTYPYFEDQVGYLKTLKEGIAKGGKLIIIDYKKRKLPIGPPVHFKVPLYQIEFDLETAGYKHISSDDRSLDYQYMIIAEKL